jgi:hypothetical protein
MGRRSATELTNFYQFKFVLLLPLPSLYIYITIALRRYCIALLFAAYLADTYRGGRSPYPIPSSTPSTATSSLSSPPSVALLGNLSPLDLCAGRGGNANVFMEDISLLVAKQYKATKSFVRVRGFGFGVVVREY